MTTWV